MLFVTLFILLLILNSILYIYIYIYIIYICSFVIILFMYVGKKKFKVSNKDTLLQIKYIWKNFIHVFTLSTTKLVKYVNIIFHSNFFSLKWKPLFKKSSYFGIYRSTRNQFLNK